MADTKRLPPLALAAELEHGCKNCVYDAHVPLTVGVVRQASATIRDLNDLCKLLDDYVAWSVVPQEAVEQSLRLKARLKYGE